MWPHGSPLALCSLLTVMAVSLLPIHCSHIFPNLTSDIWHRPECHHRSRTGWLVTELKRCDSKLRGDRIFEILKPDYFLAPEHNLSCRELSGGYREMTGLEDFVFKFQLPEAGDSLQRAWLEVEPAELKMFLLDFQPQTLIIVEWKMKNLNTLNFLLNLEFWSFIESWNYFVLKYIKTTSISMRISSVEIPSTLAWHSF